MDTQTKKLDGYLTEDDVRALLRPGKTPLSRRTLILWRQQRTGPPFVKFGAQILYPERGIYRWLEARTTEPVRERSRRSGARA
jgi:hypothetical protein